MIRKGFTLLTLMGLVAGGALIREVRVEAASQPALTASAGGLNDPARATSSKPLLLVSNVTFEKHATGEVFVDVATSRSPSYHTTKLFSPPRLVIDIEDAQTASPHKDYTADTAILKGVRVGQFQAKDPAVVRIVADLNGNPACSVHLTPGGMRIELRPQGTALPAPAPAPGIDKRKSIESAGVSAHPVVANKVAKPTPVPATAPQTDQHKLSAMARITPPVPVNSPSSAPSLSTRKVSDMTPINHASSPAPAANIGASAPVPAASDKVSTPLRLSNDKSPAPAAVNAAVFPSPMSAVTSRKEIPAATTQPTNSAAPNPAGSVQEVAAPLPPPVTSTQVAAAPVPPPAGATPEVLRAERAAQILAPAKQRSADAQGVAPATSSAPTGENKPAYTGELISLNLKDVDLKDFFRLIHEISGLNIIIDPNVNGGVTLVLDSVPWDQALDIVLKDNGLGKILEGNVLRIARMSTLTAEQEEVNKLDVARLNAAPLVTIFRTINYAKAQEIAQLLKTGSGGKSGGWLSPRGNALYDLRGNTVIVSDVASQIPAIQDMIDKLDRKAKQISIESRVVLANANFVRTLAGNLLGGFINNSTNSTGVSGLTSTLQIPNPQGPVTVHTPITANGFGIAAVTNVGANYYINAAISAAEERDQAKTISRPSIVTQNNVEGMVQQGVQVPIQTTINNTISVQYYNATLQLRVTPQVTDSTDIFLKIEVQNNSVGAAVSNIGPEIATQQATTSVLVPDGGTVVFGGITVTTRSKTANYIPLLGSIPVLGNLFKNSQTQDQDQELLFFVSPKILPT